MPEQLRRRFARILLWEPYTKTILDLASRRVLVTSSPSGEEDRVQVASGGERPIRRRHVLEIPLTDDESVSMARVLSRKVQRPMQAILIGSDGAEHWTWFEPTIANLTEGGASPLTGVSATLRLQTSIFKAAVGRGFNLAASAPWKGYSGGLDSLEKPSLFGVGVLDTDALLTGIQRSGDEDQINVHDSQTQALAERFAAAESSPEAISYGTYQSTGILVATGGQNIRIIDKTDGSSVTAQTQGDTVGVTYDQAAPEWMYAIVGGDIYLENTSTISTFASDMSGLAWDGTDIYYADGTDLVQLDGKTSTELNRYDLGFQIRDIGRSEYVTSGTTTLLIAEEGSPTVYESAGWDGTLTEKFDVQDETLGERTSSGVPLWKVAPQVEPGLDGMAASLDDDLPATFEFRFPAWDSVIKLAQADGCDPQGELRAYDVNGTLLSSVQDGAELTVPFRTWTVEARLEEQVDGGGDATPYVRVRSVGPAVGITPGDIDGATPKWATLETATATELSRIESAGGTVTPGLPELLIDELNLADTYQFLGVAGARETVSGKHRRVFDWSSNDWDLLEEDLSNDPEDRPTEAYFSPQRFGSRMEGNNTGFKQTSVTAGTEVSLYTATDVQSQSGGQQHIASVDGLYIYERQGEIVAEVQSLNDTWSTVGSFPAVAEPAGMIVYNNNLCVGSTTTRAVFEWDGSSWSELGSFPANAEEDLEYLTIYNGNLVVAANQLSKITSINSWDGSTWSKLGTYPGKLIGGLAVWRGDLYATDEENDAVYKYNGIAWSELGSFPVQEPKGICPFRGDLYVISGAGEALHRWDTLGNGWVEVLSPPADLRGESLSVYNGYLFSTWNDVGGTDERVYWLNGGEIKNSTDDGPSWPSGNPTGALTYGNQIHVNSINGVYRWDFSAGSWTDTSFPGQTPLGGVVWNGQLYYSDNIDDQVYVTGTGASVSLEWKDNQVIAAHDDGSTLTLQVGSKSASVSHSVTRTSGVPLRVGKAPGSVESGAGGTANPSLKGDTAATLVTESAINPDIICALEDYYGKYG